MSSVRIVSRLSSRNSCMGLSGWSVRRRSANLVLIRVPQFNTLLCISTRRSFRHPQSFIVFVNPIQLSVLSSVYQFLCPKLYFSASLLYQDDFDEILSMYASMIVNMAERHSSPDSLCSPISSTIRCQSKNLEDEPLPWGRTNLGEPISWKIHWSTVTEAAWASLNLRLKLGCTILWCWIILENHHQSPPDIQLESDWPISIFRPTPSPAKIH